MDRQGTYSDRVHIHMHKHHKIVGKRSFSGSHKHKHTHTKNHRHYHKTYGGKGAFSPESIKKVTPEINGLTCGVCMKPLQVRVHRIQVVLAHDCQKET